MEDFLINYPWVEMIFQLILALFLGAFLGLERSYLGKSAGTRTFGLISFGSCLFTIVSLNAFTKYMYGISSYDPSRIVAQIIAGIGFISMAVVIHRGSDVEGLTTAVGLWVSAGIGVAVGVNFYILALAATLITLLVMGFLRLLDLENRLESLRLKSKKKK